jgi:hypothetical protein
MNQVTESSYAIFKQLNFVLLTALKSSYLCTFQQISQFRLFVPQMMSLLRLNRFIYAEYPTIYELYLP